MEKYLDEGFKRYFRGKCIYGLNLLWRFCEFWMVGECAILRSNVWMVCDQTSINYLSPLLAHSHSRWVTGSRTSLFVVQTEIGTTHNHRSRAVRNWCFAGRAELFFSALSSALIGCFKTEVFLDSGIRGNGNGKLGWK